MTDLATRERALSGEPELGHELLDAVAAFIARYVVFPSEEALTAVVLWVAHTHCFAACEVTPYLHLTSAEKRCGKSRLKDVLRALVANPWAVVEPTEAVVFRKLDAEHPTLLLDEVDVIFAKNSPHEGLRAILNAGHEAGNAVPRCVGPTNKLVNFDIFTPKCLVGIGDLPPTVADRSIAIRMKRRMTSTEPVESFRRKQAVTLGGPLRKRIAAWAEAHVEALDGEDPSMPESLNDREADYWQPLFAIADAAGGDWPERAWTACVELAGQSEDESYGTRLLADCRTAFGDDDLLASATLAERLVAMEEAPWGDLRGRPLDARGLARRLRLYEVRPTQLWDEGGKIRGYKREFFAEAWDRYVRSPEGVLPLVSGMGSVERYGAGQRPFLAENPISADGPESALDQPSTVLPIKKPIPSGRGPSGGPPENVRTGPGDGSDGRFPLADEVGVTAPPVPGPMGPCHRCGRSTGLLDDERRYRCSRCRLDEVRTP